MKTKICKKCEKEKELNFFANSKTCKNGVRNICKKCSVLKTKKWRIENRDKYLIWNNEYQKNRYKDHKEHINNQRKEYAVERARNDINILTDNYIKRLLWETDGLKFNISESSPPLISLRRNNLKTKRIINRNLIISREKICNTCFQKLPLEKMKSNGRNKKGEKYYLNICWKCFYIKRKKLNITVKQK